MPEKTENTLTVTDNRTGKKYETANRERHYPRHGPATDQGSEGDFGLMSYDPAFTNTASCESRVTFIDGEKGILRVPRIPDRAARRAQHVS